MTKTTEEKPAPDVRRMTTREYWDWMEIKVYRRALEMAWEDHGLPALLDFVKEWPSGQAFVLGSGPSIENVTAGMWGVMSRWLTVGVNFFAAWYQTNSPGPRPRVPALAFGIDRVRDPGRSGLMRRSFETLRAAGGRVLVGFDGVDMPHDWSCPTYGMRPIDDLRFGLTSTATGRGCGFMCSRSAIAMVYLLVLAGIRNVCLVGCDHGRDYKPNEPEKAGIAYGNLAVWAGRHGARIWQCGSMAGFEAEGVGRKKLKTVVAGRWSGTR